MLSSCTPSKPHRLQRSKRARMIGSNTSSLRTSSQRSSGKPAYLRPITDPRPASGLVRSQEPTVR
jgi:hypothetical protein